MLEVVVKDPWRADADEQFANWKAAHPDAPMSSTVLAFWKCEKVARRNYRRRMRVPAPCPKCHGKGTVLRSRPSK